jgi:hypothetical protein
MVLNHKFWFSNWVLREFAPAVVVALQAADGLQLAVAHPL